MTTARSDAHAVDRQAKRFPRWSLGALSLVHAVVFAMAGRALPWRTFTPFAVACYVLALAHATASASAFAPVRWRKLALAIAASLSGLFLAAITYAAVSRALYVASLYDVVGAPLAGAVAAAWCAVALFTLPYALFGAAVLVSRRVARRATLPVAVAGIAFAFLLATRAAAARGETALPPEATEATTSALLRDRIGSIAKTKLDRTSLFVASPGRCTAAPTAARATLLATYFASNGKPSIQCVQGPSLEAAVDTLRSDLVDGYAGGPLAIDVVTRVQTLDDLDPFVGALALRPSRDGVCLGARCLAPFQLVGIDAFTKAGALATFDIKLGVSATHLRAALGSPSDAGFDGLVRIATETYVVLPDGSVEPLVHLARRAPPLAPRGVRDAVENASAFIASAEDRDGRFHYTTDPFSSATSMAGFGVPRQAGTTLALCDAAGLAKDTAPIATRALGVLASFEVRNGDVAGIGASAGDTRPAWLGSSALTMAALLACRRVVGDRFDGLIDRLGNGLLLAERTDGSFAPRFDIAKSSAVDGRLQLYAGGQAILGLVGWEAAKAPSLHPPADLGARIDRAMDYIAGPYWSGPLYDFFFLEENWHCIAARDALQSHRRDAYERFCLDYVDMKKRLYIGEDDTRDPTFVGGYGFGTVIPPHDAATGGFGETLAAAIDIRRARGLDASDDEARLANVVSYLLSRQWSDSRSLFMTDRVRVAGAFSENVGSPTIRIDFVQHTLAAIVHGGLTLGLLANENLAKP